ncbi:hypothetical protein ACFX11_034786 [Malus domestica]
MPPLTISLMVIFMTISDILLAFSYFSCFSLCAAVEVSVKGAGSSSLSAKSRSIKLRTISMSCFHFL